MKGLGRHFNVVPVATGKGFNLENYAGITFVTYEDAGDQQIVFTETIDGASSQALTTVNELYASNGVGGVWTRESSDSAGDMDDNSTVEKADTTPFDCASIYIGADELTIVDGYNTVVCTIDGAGLCIAILHDLLVQRQPENLPASGA